MATQPLRYRDSLSLWLAFGFNFVMLDAAFRLDGLLSSLSRWQIAVGGSFVFLLVLAGCSLVALPFWQVEQRLARRENYRPWRATMTLVGLLLAYLNSLYLKFFLRVTSIPDTKQLLMVVSGVLFLAAVVAVVVAGKFSIEQFRDQLDFLYWAGLALGVAAVVCIGWALIDHQSAPVRTGSKDHPHVVMLSFDSLTATHMSLYGYERKTTPFLEQLAQQSTVFERAISNADHTPEGLTALIGAYPRGDALLDPERTVLPVLKEVGYQRRVLYSFMWGGPNFRRGFTRLDKVERSETTPLVRFLTRAVGRQNVMWLTTLLSLDSRSYNLWHPQDPRDRFYPALDPYPLPETLDAALDTLRRSPGPAFVWAHLWQPHANYCPYPGFVSPYGDQPADKFDGVVAFLDGEVERFVAGLKEAGLWENTLLVITADHGESFGEDNPECVAHFHGPDWFNPAVTHIPLIFHAPGQTRAGRPQTFADQMDVAPTLLQMLGIAIPDWMPGESLVPYFDDQTRMSQRLRISIPSSWHLRKTDPLVPLPALWAFGDREMFLAHWNHYRVGWMQSYRPRPDKPSRLDVFKDFGFTAIYDLVGDPALSRNLLVKPLPELDNQQLLEKVYRDPVVTQLRGAKS